MSLISTARYALVALSVAGSATLLFSCSKKPSDTVYDLETLMTESSEHRTVIMSENGRVSYEFSTPLVEGYGMAANPYREFRRGVAIKTFTSDTLPLVDATLRANYAIYYENQKLWEAKGNVVIYKYNRNEGDTAVVSRTEVYTQQLFWNAKTQQIYSNVDTKVLQSDGWHFGVGFDADESLKNIHFRKYSSEMEFDMGDDGAEDTAASDDAGGKTVKPAAPQSGRTGGNAERKPAPAAPKKGDDRNTPQSISGGGRSIMQQARQASSQRQQTLGADDRSVQRQSISNTEPRRQTVEQ